jgi:hypothetical protein
VAFPLSQVQEQETAKFALPKGEDRDGAAGVGDRFELLGFFAGDAFVFDLEEVGATVLDGNEVGDPFAPRCPHDPIALFLQLLFQPPFLVGALPIALHRDHLLHCAPAILAL